MYRGEVFKEVFIDDTLKKRYAISNYGRLMSFVNSFSDGRNLKCSIINGFRIFKYKIFNNSKFSNKHVFLYKLVAQHFLDKPNQDQEYLIHLNHDTLDDHYHNLKWVTYEEKFAHRKTNPKFIESFEKFKKFNIKRDGAKLTSTNVLRIKKILQNPKRKISVTKLAKEYDVSTTQIYRIKRGENWKHLDKYIISTNND